MSPAACDAIVVLGCRVRADGRPSLALARRVRRGVELWSAGRAPIVLLCGGRGDHLPAEAVAAARLARSLGAHPSALRLERRSTTTAENARFAAEQLPSARRVLVVTDPSHALRARRVFARHFAEVEVAWTRADLRSQLRAAPRELGALLIYAWQGRL